MRQIILLILMALSTQVIGQNYVKINNGSSLTKDHNVTLTLQSANALRMQLSSEPDFNGAKWLPFKASYHWIMDNTEGTHYVYARFEERGTKKISDPVNTSINLDITPPTEGYIKFSQPSKIINTKTFLTDLRISAVDAKYMMLSNHNTFYGGRWQVYEEEKFDWQMEQGADGPRYIYVKFKDKAQNESEVHFDKIMIDNTPPFNGTVKINNGDKYSTHQDKKIDVKIFCHEADSMKISQEADQSTVTWEAYTTDKVIELTGDDGIKKIYLTFKDLAGNTTKQIIDEIILDTTAPQNCKVVIDNGAKSTTDLNKKVQLQISAEGASYMMISNSPTFHPARWRTYTDHIGDWQLIEEHDGKRVVYVKFKDEAGNISTVVYSSIELKRGF